MSQSSELDELEMERMEENAKPVTTKRAIIYGLKKFTVYTDADYTSSIKSLNVVFVE